jgi:hypothetical protein
MEKLTAEKDWPISNPWPWLVGGLASMVVGWALVELAPRALTAMRVLLVFAGALGALVGVVIRPGSAKVLATASATAFIGAWALYVQGRPGEWDSIRWFLAVAALVALVAAAIVAVPRVWRRLAVSVVIVVHFGGVLTAVLAAPPSPWLANLLWVSVYRPYLQFMYLINAYHFYAPNPGNSFFFWFQVRYTRDSDPRKVPQLRLFKVPDLEDGWPQYPLALQYQRRLAMAAYLAQKGSVAVPPADVARRHERANLTRSQAGLPIFPVVGTASYLPPNPPALPMLQSFVRHIAKKFLREEPGTTIVHIRVYRVEHVILDAPNLARGEGPDDPHTYLPHYWGKFDERGTLLDPDDPYLYWLMPFLKIKPGQSPLFVTNVDILRPLAGRLKKYLGEYAEDEAVARREPPEMLNDISTQIKNKYQVPAEERLRLVLDDLSSLLGKYPMLAIELLKHRKELVQKGRAPFEEIAELVRIIEIWNAGRLRVPRDSEDHFDLAVATATSVEADPIILNYAQLHAGDSKWVRYPGKAVYEELRPELLGNP